MNTAALREETLKRPYTVEEIVEIADQYGCITVILAVSFYDVVNMTEEEFNDELCAEITEECAIHIETYDVAGHDGNTLFLEVEANVKDIIDEYNEEQEALHDEEEDEEDEED